MSLKLFRELFWVFLFPLSVLWAAVARARRACRKTAYVSHLPVLCVGNIHSGGSGKTPLVAAISEKYRDKQLAILSRGFRGRFEGSFAEVNLDSEAGAAEFGDEPWMLAQIVKVPVFVGGDRVAALKKMEAMGRFRAVLLDDGFQHLRLGRTLDIVAIACEKKKEEAYCLPLGELREPLSALRYAGAVVLTGEDGSEAKSWRAFLAERYSELPVFFAKRVYDFPKQSGLAAFSGIAGSERFEKIVRQQGAAWLRAFPDHHSYSDADLSWLLEQKRQTRAKGLLTTEKDFFKLEKRFAALGESLHRVRIGYDLSPEFWYFLQNRWMPK